MVVVGDPRIESSSRKRWWFSRGRGCHTIKGIEDREPDVHEYTFKAANDQMTLDLSWVPMSRLNVDRAEKPS